MNLITAEHKQSKSATKRIEVLTISAGAADCDRLREIFSHTNWIFRCAPDLGAAMDVLREHPVPVVLCGAAASDCNWRDVLRTVQDLTCPPEVVVITEDADESLWREIFDAGARDVLTKPFDPSDLYEVISLASHAWRLRQTPSGTAT
jgi:DNA-binding response OmpR family regulator